MKRIYCTAAFVAAILASCQKLDFSEQPLTRQFTFTVKGDFSSPTFTRGSLQADGKDMTDLWVFDYVGDVCVQTLHQDATSADFGTPSLSLTYGEHHVYFVASRGLDPVVADGSTVISWSSVRDTFWKDYSVNVTSSSNGNRSVTLDRVATKLRIAVDDAVPDGCASAGITPDTWYYGLDYTTGAATGVAKREISISVPSSLAGTTGSLAFNVFCISPASEWTTNVQIRAMDGSGAVIGSAKITGAPFRRNRSTEYHGNLFGSSGTTSVLLNAEWDAPSVGTW